MTLYALSPEQKMYGFIKTGEQVKQELYAQGVTLTQWADDNNYNYDTVCKVISGVRKARNGLGHEIAVALGMKAKPTEQNHLKKDLCEASQ